MNTSPTPEQIAKLPVWARAHIKNITREREVALKALNRYVDDQTTAPFYIDEMECTGEQQGPSFKRRYVQTSKMAVEFKGVELTIYLREREGIELQWSTPHRGGGNIAFVPTSFQAATLVPRDMMRD